MSNCEKVVLPVLVSVQARLMLMCRQMACIGTTGTPPFRHCRTAIQWVALPVGRHLVADGKCIIWSC